MVNYRNGKIYKIVPIVEHDPCDVYYGATTKKYLSQRFDEHRRDFKRNDNCSSKILFQKYGVENCVIILLESVDAKTNDELKAVEAKYIINNLCVNKNIPLRTSREYNKQYYTENKDTIDEKCKQYYTENKDTIAERKKQYNIINKDTISEYQKQYRIKNKEVISEKCKQYGIKNKEAIAEKNKQYRLKKKAEKEQANTKN
jgi:hypothetical protein